VSRLEFQVRVDAQGPYECNLEMTTDVIDVTSAFGVRSPNLAWEFVDEAGHYHSFTKDGHLPTTSVHSIIHGAGSDEEWTETYRVCKLCAETIDPKYDVDHSTQVMPGRSSWIAEVRGVHLEAGKEVSLAFSTAHTGRVRYFGIGKVIALNITDSTYVTLVGGTGELGRKK
jgi:hypothetical protein